jgi:uncharacterized protein YeaO (DUF488 family)
MAVRLKRAYDDPSREDGTRVLVDRLWPRGVSKASARIDRWMKDIGPSAELRKWFGHDPARWEPFKKRYFAELDGKPDLVAELRRLGRRGTLTLVYGAKDERHNNAVALKAYLSRRGRRTSGRASRPRRGGRV